MFTLDTEIDALASRTAAGASAYLSRVDFFKVGKIAQLNTVSHGQCMSSLLIKHWSVTDKLARSTGLAASSLSVTAASYLTELALVVSRTEAAVLLTISKNIFNKNDNNVGHCQLSTVTREIFP